MTPAAPQAPATAAAAAGVSPTAQKPPLPRVHPSLLADTQRVSAPIRHGSVWEEQQQRWNKALKALLPHRQLEQWDHIPVGFRSEWVRRQVRTPYLYLQNLMATAMAAPQNYGFRYEPAPVAQPMGQPEQMGGDPLLTAVGEHWRLVVDAFLKDCGAQEKLNAWAQDADAFGCSVLKVQFHTDVADDLVADVTMRDDEQDQLRRITDLRRQVATRDVTRFDPEMRELEDLQAGIGQSAELSVVKRLVVEHIQIPCIQIDPAIDNLENIYEARWIAHLIITTRGELRAEYPYKYLGEQDGYDRFEGVHPDHADGLTPVGFSPSQWESLKARRKRESSGTEEAGDGDPILLIELHHRARNRVYLLADGLDYPIRSFVPKKQPQQWYPFVFLVPRRLPGDPRGIGSIELGAELQKVSHIKVSDGNIARYLGMNRLVYDKGAVDERDIRNLGEVPPGAAFGMDLKGDKVGDVLQSISMDYDPLLFDDSREQQDLRRAGSMPEQFQGVTGSAHYAREVEAAMQGAQISMSWVQEQVRLALVRFHAVVLDLVLQHVHREEAKEVAGKHVLWPSFLEEAEAKAFDQRIDAQLKGRLVRMQWIATALGKPISELSWRQWYEQERQRILIETTGWPEIVTRRDLQRRLNIDVRISMNKDLERRAKRQDFNGLLQTLIPTGLVPGRQQLGRTLIEMYDMQPETAGMFQVDPARLVADLVAMVQQNPAALPPEAATQLLAIVQASAQASGLAQPGQERQSARPPGQPQGRSQESEPPTDAVADMA